MTIEFIVSWADADVPFDVCRKCQYGTYEVDPYGTGDSPATVECNASRETQCEYMERYEIDITKLENIVLGDVDTGDAPKFCDAFIDSAEYRGEELDELKLEWLNNNHLGLINELAFESLYD